MKDKVVIITGASSGIGKALAFAFGREGAKIVITGRKKEPLEAVSNELKAENIENLAITGDVSVEKDNEIMVNQTLEKYGKIDILINNAGISMRSMFEDVELEVIKKVMDINFYGVVYATKYALPHIKATKGSIIGISSIAGYRGLPVRSGYSASKFALNGFLEALRTELLKTGVHVLTACPGFTASNIRVASLGSDGQSKGDSMRDEGKMMSAEEVADAILNATKKRKRDLVLTSQGKLTVFLNKWLPKLMDTMVYNTLAKEKDSPLR
ncbi:Short-chain dehydrogenase [Pseudarcicella hirudinis]|uniref:Short-chain dehydrogenase n=1 Tax=Pseudarcicella hirudinis TaxID=1079859 RepID=A0A1I5N0S5_9BACT|nr:SDR family oxidoreductase [Pseudarcicella hirudinis]SFP15277.1 Short-chain dehydrogenase [Pseudarcicella hirudinis]